MKRFMLLATFVMAIYVTNAQDVIVLRNAEEIQAKVTVVAQNQVTYKRWSNLEGPTYTIDKSQIFYIKYQNGDKDVMGTTCTPVESVGGVVNSPQQNLTSITPVKFQGYVNLGTVFNGYVGGPTFDVTAGARIYEYLYVGVETGFHTLFEYGYLYGYIPVGVNMKGYFTRNNKVNPYLNCTLGGFFGVGEFDGFNSFHCQVGLGIDVKRFTFGIGYNALVVEGESVDMGYIRLGFRFGK